MLPLRACLALTLTFTAKNRVGIVSSTAFSIERNPKIGMPAQSLVELRLLRDRLESAIRRAHRNGTKVAVLFIDLDYFKTVNDSLGHEAGDRILVQVANRLRAVFRETDTIARFGGDEFVAVMPDVKKIGDIIPVAEKVLRVLDTPFEINGEEAYLSAYRAKEEGKRGFFFNEEMNRKAVELLSMKSRLHRALERGEFTLHYQPMYRIETLEIVGLEALLRWRDPESGYVPPSKFLPLLEDLGLIREVGEWVMEGAFKTSKPSPRTLRIAKRTGL